MLSLQSLRTLSASRFPTCTEDHGWGAIDHRECNAPSRGPMQPPLR
jgi:hypothetical protein